MTVEAALPLVVDTDGGIDDLVALWLLAKHPSAYLRAVVATGLSRPASIVARNAGMILSLAGVPDGFPIAIGADRPLGAAPELRAVPHHGPEGIGSLRPWCELADRCLPDAAALLERVGPHRLLTLGPLATLAGLVRDGAAGGVREITVMGGAIRASGNALAAAEANIARDPSAAAAVIAHPWPRPLRLITLDATQSATLGPDEVELLGSLPGAGSVLGPLLKHYGRFASADGSYFPCHDVLAACSVVRPEIVETELLPVSVDTGGSAAWAMTVADRRPSSPQRASVLWPYLDVATSADEPAFRAMIRATALGEMN